MLVRLSEAQGRVLAQTNPETLIPLLLLLLKTGTEKASVLSPLRSGICKHSEAHTISRNLPYELVCCLVICQDDMLPLW